MSAVAEGDVVLIAVIGDVMNVAHIANSVRKQSVMDVLNRVAAVHRHHVLGVSRNVQFVIMITVDNAYNHVLIAVIERVRIVLPHVDAARIIAVAIALLRPVKNVKKIFVKDVWQNAANVTMIFAITVQIMYVYIVVSKCVNLA